MSNRLLMNSTAMSPATTDADFAFAPMQPNLGFDVAGNSHQDQHNLYDNFVDFAAGFPFQQDSSMSLLPPQTSRPLLAPPPCLAMTAMPSLSLNHQMPLPGVQNAEMCHPFNGSAGSPFLMKREDGPLVDAGGGGGGGRLGLNLGRLTYFSPADVLAVDRLLMTRSSRFGVGMGMAGLLGLGLGAAHHHQPPPPRCQAEGCKADLSAAKHYHRRHKVCEYHAKAAAVADGGKQKRFCQQCSRFHVLAEFDESKRSCRKRLTEHNRRRRKSASAQGGEDSSPPPKKADTTSITTSYNSDQKSASTVAAKSTAITPNGSGVSCLDMADNNGHQTSSAAAAAAPTALSLAAPPEKDSGGLDAILMMHGSRVHRDDDEDQRFIPSLLLQAQQQQQHHNDGGHMLSCSSSMPDQHQNGGGGRNGFFEVDFV